MTDPIADFLTRIRNAQMAHRDTVSIPYSQAKEGIAKVMQKSNFLKKVTIVTSEKFPTLLLELPEKELTLKRVSTCGQRIYAPAKGLRKVCNGFGISTLSTSKGIMTGYEARGKNIGGEILCEIS